MENIKKLRIRATLLAMLVITTHIVAALPKTPAAVENFYSSMKAMGYTSDPNRAYDLQKSMKECFYANSELVSGIDIPNDFRHFSYDSHTSSHSFDFLTSVMYINKIYEYIYKDKIMKVDYDIRSNEYFGVQPEFEEGKLSASTMPCIKTCVRKTYIVGGQRNVFDETIYTDAQSGKIYDISNGGEIKSFKIKAAEAYRNKDYTTAYQCYEKIVQTDKNDMDALYRLALMTYYRKGCTLSRKEAHRKGKAYMTHVNTSKAYNVLHFWNYTVL